MHVQHIAQTALASNYFGNGTAPKLVEKRNVYTFSPFLVRMRSTLSNKTRVCIHWLLVTSAFVSSGGVWGKPSERVHRISYFYISAQLES